MIERERERLISYFYSGFEKPRIIQVHSVLTLGIERKKIGYGFEEPRSMLWAIQSLI